MFCLHLGWRLPVTLCLVSIYVLLLLFIYYDILLHMMFTSSIFILTYSHLFCIDAIIRSTYHALHNLFSAFLLHNWHLFWESYNFLLFFCRSSLTCRPMAINGDPICPIFYNGSWWSQFDQWPIIKNIGVTNPWQVVFCCEIRRISWNPADFTWNPTDFMWVLF